LSAPGLTGGRLPDEKLTAGDIVPAVEFADATGNKIDLISDEIAGHFQILLFAADGSADLVRPFADRLAELAALDGRIWFVRSPSSRLKPAAGLTILVDERDALDRLFGPAPAAGAAKAVIIGPNQHLVVVLKSTDGDLLDRVEEILTSRSPGRRTADMDIHPPVLLVPDVLSPADCQNLMSVYTMRGNEFVPPGHMTLQGRTTDCKMYVDDYGREDRVDHWVIEQDTNQLLDKRLAGRLFPEIRRAFQYNVTRREHYRIATYTGARRGEHHGHRDNSEELVAHRRFAVTFNLNTENYQGGAIRFPEFGDQRYRPPSGAAIVFSSSLLHEVLEVEGGRRFALLAFLFGES